MKKSMITIASLAMASVIMINGNVSAATVNNNKIESSYSTNKKAHKIEKKKKFKDLNQEVKNKVLLSEGVLNRWKEGCERIKFFEGQ